MNEDAMSQNDISKQKQPRLKKRHFRGKKIGVASDRNEKHILESIEEQKHEKDEKEDDEESKH
jgi:hypothetical protein